MTKTVKILLTGLSVLVLLLVLVNIFIGIGNQSIQSEVSERQQVIAQTMQLEALNRQLINVLANLALKTNDEPLMGVLAAAGINLQTGPANQTAGEVRQVWTTRTISKRHRRSGEEAAVPAASSLQPAAGYHSW